MDSYLFSSLYGSRTYVIGDNVDNVNEGWLSISCIVDFSTLVYWCHFDSFCLLHYFILVVDVHQVWDRIFFAFYFGHFFVSVYVELGYFFLIRFWISGLCRVGGFFSTFFLMVFIIWSCANYMRDTEIKYIGYCPHLFQWFM